MLYHTRPFVDSNLDPDSDVNIVGGEVKLSEMRYAPRK